MLAKAMEKVGKEGVITVAVGGGRFGPFGSGGKDSPGWARMVNPDVG